MQHRIRGIAQLVEQRSPKPRAVSSKLTTPAITAQVLRSLCVLFLYSKQSALRQPAFAVIQQKNTPKS